MEVGGVIPSDATRIPWPPGKVTVSVYANAEPRYPEENITLVSFVLERVSNEDKQAQTNDLEQAKGQPATGGMLPPK